MPIAAVVSLHSVPKWIAGKTTSIKRNVTGKECVRVRRPRKTNPALTAQGHMKCRAIAKVPGDRMSIYLQRSLTRIFFDSIVLDSKTKRIVPSRAQFQPP